MDSGLIGAVIGALLSGFPIYFHQKYKIEKEKKACLCGWLKNLSVQGRLLVDWINEILVIVSNHQISSKKLNEKFLEEARSALVKYNLDKEFLKCLNRASEDITQTNIMLAGSISQQINVIGVIQALKVTLDNINKMNIQTDKTLKKLENQQSNLFQLETPDFSVKNILIALIIASIGFALGYALK